MRGGDYKGQPSDYQEALRKWNEQKGWNQTNIYQIPHKGHRDVKASQAYKEVMELMEGSRTGAWNAAKRRLDELLEALPATGDYNRARVQKVTREHLDVIQKKTKDERKWTKVLNEDIDDIVEKFKAKYGYDPLSGEAPLPAAEANVKVKGFAPSTEKQEVRTTPKGRVTQTLPSPHEKYLATIKLFEEYLTTLPEAAREYASETFLAEQKKIMSEVEAEHTRVMRLQTYLNRIYPAKNRLNQIDETAF